MSQTVSASAVVLAGSGVLIRGRPGSGKSTLALALMEAGGRLVGDDRVHLAACHGRLVACGHGAIAGMIELRGAGPLKRPAEAATVIRLAVDLQEEPVDRLPDAQQRETVILGIRVRRQAIARGDPNAARLVAESLRSADKRA